MRGKGIKWTKADDKLILSGKQPKGHTAEQIRNRRSHLKRLSVKYVKAMSVKLLSRVEYMSELGLFTDADRKFLVGVIDKIDKIVRK